MNALIASFGAEAPGWRLPFLEPVYQAFAWLLAFFYGLIPNLGVSILLITVVIMGAMFPLTAKQSKSMLEMQRVQPELKKLQAKYKGDRQKLNEETMKFFQEHKINPLASCLPLVVQMPIFISLFEVLRRPYRYVPIDSQLYTDLCGDVTRAACGDSADLPHHLRFLSMDLSTSAMDAHSSLLSAMPYYVLVGLVVLTGLLQGMQSKRNSPNMNPQMAMITRVMPIGFGVFSLFFPSGLVLYFFASNLWRVGQQEIILRRYAHLRTPGTAVDVKGTVKEEPSGGGVLGRLRALTEQRAGEPEPEPEPETKPKPKPQPKRSGSKNRKRKR